MKILLIKMKLKKEVLLSSIEDYDYAILNKHRDKSRKALLMQKREYLKGQLSIINIVLKAEQV